MLNKGKFSDQRKSYVVKFCGGMRTSLKKVEAWIVFYTQVQHGNTVTLIDKFSNTQTLRSRYLWFGRTPGPGNREYNDIGVGLGLTLRYLRRSKKVFFKFQ